MNTTPFRLHREPVSTSQPGVNNHGRGRRTSSVGHRPLHDQHRVTRSGHWESVHQPVTGRQRFTAGSFQDTLLQDSPRPVRDQAGHRQVFRAPTTSPWLQKGPYKPTAGTVAQNLADRCERVLRRQSAATWTTTAQPYWPTGPPLRSGRPVPDSVPCSGLPTSGGAHRYSQIPVHEPNQRHRVSTTALQPVTGKGFACCRRGPQAQFFPFSRLGERWSGKCVWDWQHIEQRPAPSAVTRQNTARWGRVTMGRPFAGRVRLPSPSPG